MNKIIVIKLGAKGDLVRTLGIAKALKEKYPERKVVWVTKSSNKEIVKANKYIDSVFSLEERKEVLGEEFELALNLDIDKEATALIGEVKAKEKRGFYAEGEYAQAYLPEGEYYLNTMFDDELKKSNKRTYQEMIFASAGLKHDAKKYKLEVAIGSNEKKYALEFAKKNGLAGIENSKENNPDSLEFSKGQFSKTRGTDQRIAHKKTIGLHIGSSPRWPSKAWHVERVFEFVKLAKSKGYEVILFSGADDKERAKLLVDKFNREKIKVVTNNPENSDLEFAGLISLCEVVVCADSFALHLALALNKKVVCLFFCTSADEIEGYGLLKKIVSKKLYDFFPERMNVYDEELTKSISADEVMRDVESFL